MRLQVWYLNVPMFGGGFVALVSLTFLLILRTFYSWHGLVCLQGFAMCACA